MSGLISIFEKLEKVPVIEIRRIPLSSESFSRKTCSSLWVMHRTEDLGQVLISVPDEGTERDKPETVNDVGV